MNRCRRSKLVALFSLGFGGLLAISASLVEAKDWVYTVRSGDTLWKISNDYLQAPDQWPQLLKYNNIEEKSQLSTGQQLRIPEAWLKHKGSVQMQPSAVLEGAEKIRYLSKDESAAELVALLGQVDLLKGDGEGALSTGSLLAPKERVRTGVGSSAHIKLNDGSVVVLLAETEITLGEPLTVNYGRIERRVAGSEAQPQVSTHAAMVSAKEARFRLTAEKQGKLVRVEVLEG